MSFPALLLQPHGFEGLLVVEEVLEKRVAAVANRDDLRPALLSLEATVLSARVPAHADVWVVAEFGHYRLFFDSDAGEFGLAQMSKHSDEYITIGVRGDLVGVYCAA